MKKLLILLSFVLSVATTGLLAQAVTAPVTADSSTAQPAPGKAGKHGKKHHKHGKKHHRQSKHGHKGHKKKQHKKAQPAEQPAPAKPESK